MKKPLIEKCPCCETTLVPDESDMNYVGYKPFCDVLKQYDHTGALVYCSDYGLSYRCNRCGAEWEHGQFEDKTKEEQK